MKRFFEALCEKIVDFYETLFENTATAIEDGDIKRAVLNIAAGILIFLFGVLVIYILMLLAFTYQDILWAWVGIPVAVILVASYLFSNTSVEQKVETIDGVELELIRQRAREMYDDVHALVFNAIQGAAGITPLVRPHDLYDIETSAPKGDHFYLEKGVAVYQFECDLETAIDKSGEDSIQRELQRYVTKQAARYPLLTSIEAQGRAPVEVLNTRNLGGHIMLEITLTTAASIPIIEARRRARVERQQRSGDTYDRDF